MRTVTTISSVKRTSEARRARRAVPLVTRALFQHPSGTNVPFRHHAQPAHHTHPSPLTSHLSTKNLACNSSDTTFNILSKRCNLNDYNSKFEYTLVELHANLTESDLSGATAATTTCDSPNTQRGRDRKTRPRPRRDSRTNQMRKGSFLTSTRPFHHAPRPSVSPALVSGIRMRTSA